MCVTRGPRRWPLWLLFWTCLFHPIPSARSFFFSSVSLRAAWLCFSCIKFELRKLRGIRQRAPHSAIRRRLHWHHSSNVYVGSNSITIKKRTQNYIRNYIQGLYGIGDDLFLVVTVLNKAGLYKRGKGRGDILSRCEHNSCYLGSPLSIKSEIDPISPRPLLWVCYSYVLLLVLQLSPLPFSFFLSISRRFRCRHHYYTGA